MPAIPYVKNPTWADGSGGGTSIDAADLNKVEAGIFEISYAPAVRVYHNATQSISDAVETSVAFNSERFDQAGNAADTMHDTVTNNSRLTCRYAGVYQISTTIGWAAGPGATYLRIRRNGTDYIAAQNYVAGTSLDVRQQSLTTLYLLAVNDYVEVRVFQDTAGAQNISASGTGTTQDVCEFMMVRVA